MCTWAYAYVRAYITDGGFIDSPSFSHDYGPLEDYPGPYRAETYDGEGSDYATSVTETWIPWSSGRWILDAYAYARVP